jgi:hypothetical protein
MSLTKFRSDDFSFEERCRAMKFGTVTSEMIPTIATTTRISTSE